jgi:hypothetical protein
MGSDTYSVVWSGFVQPVFSETYTFYTYTDDGVRLTVDGQVIIDRFASDFPTEYSGTITLEAGQKYSIKMEFYKNTGFGKAQLLWSGPSQAKQVIPRENLYPHQKTFYTISHKVLTIGGNSFLVGDNVPVSCKFRIQKPVSNPAVAINLDIKKADISSSGFVLKEIKSGEVLDKRAVNVLKNGVQISEANFSLAVDSSAGDRKFVISVTGNFINMDVLEIKYRTKISAQNLVYNTGIQKYLDNNGLNNTDMFVYFEVNRWVEGGILKTTPYTVESTDDVNERLNFAAGIKVENPNILD